MHYYIVFQNQAYEESRIEGRHEEISEGDMIFKYEGGAIVAVGIIGKKTYPDSTLQQLGIIEHKLQKKLRIKEVFKEIKGLMNQEPSPFAIRWTQENRFHKLNEACGQFILDQIRVHNQF